MTPPRRRRTDRGVRGWASWCYRHLVPFASIALAAWAISSAENASQEARNTAKQAKRGADLAITALGEQRRGRGLAISEACIADEALADVMRRILQDALSTRPNMPAATPERAQRIQAARRLYEHLFEPLGGLEPLDPDVQAQRCAARRDRALNPPPPEQPGG